MGALRGHPKLLSLLSSQGWSELSPVQDASWDPILAGKHALILAPTGSGKTESAMLPIFDLLLVHRDAMEAQGKKWPKGFKALYITPLRALNRDLFGRLESWATELGFTVGVRHGDTTQAERAKQSRNPPDLLITTPETLQLLLYGDNLRAHLHTVRFVVLDEIHDIATTERGAQLMVALERVEEVVGQEESIRTTKSVTRATPPKPSARVGGGFQRIGLSATVAEVAPIAEFLVGRGRECEQIVVRIDKEIELDVAMPMIGASEKQLAAQLSIPEKLAAQLAAIRDLALSHERLLVFHNTRDGAEMLASRSAILDQEDGVDPILELHHGSLSAEHREHVETRFKGGDIRAMVATSSLELGIDVGAIDFVAQISSPRSVARMLQRLGRAGHHIGAVSRGRLLASSPLDAMECVATAMMAKQRFLEPLEMRENPLVVLVNQIIAMTNEYDQLGMDWTYEVLTRAQPFADLDEPLFEATWTALHESGTVEEARQKKRAMHRNGRSRRHFLNHIGMIADEKKYRVFDEASKRSIGTVDDAFVASSLHPGAALVMAGRTWSVLEIDVEGTRVRVAPAKDLGAVPQWAGSMMPVSYELAQAVADLRAKVLEEEDWPCDARVRETIAMPVQEQLRLGLAVPSKDVVTIERGERQYVVNVALGTRGNEALARMTQALLSQRLGRVVSGDSDAYRIKLRVQGELPAGAVEQTWSSLQPEGLEWMLGYLLRESPLIKHHVVYVAKQFGALPTDLDPNRTTKRKLMELLDQSAIGEETMARLLHDRFDLRALAEFVTRLQAGEIEIVEQGLGPISLQGDEDQDSLLNPIATEELLAAVEARIMKADMLLVCLNCKHRMQTTVQEADHRPKCRRCSSTLFVPLRPWQEDKIPLIAKADEENQLAHHDKLERDRMTRGAQLVSHFGRNALMCIAARGIGPDTAGKILASGLTPDDRRFWREILQAEVQYARTSAFWKRG